MKAIHSIKITVPISHVDMFGHVNNVRYLEYFETCRTDYLYSLTGRVEVSDFGLIIARAEIDFKAQARWHDELTVNMRTASVGNSSWVYEYEIVNEKENKVVAVGKTVQVAFDYKKGTSIPLPPQAREKLLKEIEETKE